MEVCRKPLPEESTPRFRRVLIPLEDYMQRAEQQKVLAQEMVERVRAMCDRAEEMSKGPCFTVP